MPDFLDLHSSTSKVLRSLTEKAMQRHGLHLGQDHLLAVLWERDGRTPGEVAAAAHVATPTVVKMANKMAISGLLTRLRDDRDNRLVRLWLTDAGRALQGPVERERQSIEEKITAGLSETEQRHLLRALTKIHVAASDLLIGSIPDVGSPTS